MEKEIVIKDRLVAPSMITPTLFIGLGGCGLKIVKRVKEHLMTRPDYEERYRALTKFTAFDTNINDLEKARQHMDDVFLLSDFEKEDYAKLATGQLFLEPDDYFTQWVPDGYRFRAGDTAGAGQIRIESRLGLYYQTKHRDVIPRLRRILEDMKNHAHGHRRLDSNEIRIVLCYSVAGGTGSGSHLPMAYLIRDLASQLGKPRIHGVAVLPSVFEDKTGHNKDGIFANGYAALKETEHLMKLGAPEAIGYPESGLEFHYNPADTTKRTVRTQPFDFLYAIDRPERFTVSDVVAAAADGLYLQLFSPIFGEQAGDYDNYTQHQRFLVPHDFEKKDVRGFTSFYGSYGSAVFLVPNEGLLEYCAKAAALDILRSSFVGQIPSDAAFDALRRNYANFNTIRFAAAGGSAEANDVHVKDFHQLAGDDQKHAKRALFEKRVRLLAEAEHQSAGKTISAEFRNIWRHGHGAAFVNPVDHDTANSGEANGTPYDRPEKSIVGYLERSIGVASTEGAVDLTRSELFRDSQRTFRDVLERARDRTLSDANGFAKEQEFDDAANGFRKTVERALEQAISSLETAGDRETSDAPAGLTALRGLRFLDGLGIDLRAQRYAFIMLSQHPARKAAADELKRLDERGARSTAKSEEQAASTAKKSGVAALFGSSGPDAKQLEDLKTNLERECEAAIKASEPALRRAYFQGLLDFFKAAESYEARLASMEDGFDQLEKDMSRRLEDLRKSGGAQANKYILDGEALQIENGERLWDYYYEDKCASEFSISAGDAELNKILAGRFIESAKKKSQTSRGIKELEDTLKDIESYARKKLEPRLLGVFGSADPVERHGYTLHQALEDEVRYRALHLSRNEDDASSRRELVRQALGRYKALPEAERIAQFGIQEPIHRDYLRDKVKRIVNERAQLLCYYNDSRDQQGGVRPCQILIGCLNPGFWESEVGRLLKGPDTVSGVQWVNDESANLQEVVFYRAVLNVPLYVFGRMEEMRSDYNKFKSMSKRPKVLHIDKNWEDSLQDLDPEAAIEFHRRHNLRRQVIGFAALYVANESANLDIERLITQRSKSSSARAGEDSYWILRPPPPKRDASAPKAKQKAGALEAAAPITPDESEGRYAPLGEDLRDAIANLPTLLQNNPVDYKPYQVIINKVSKGLAPRVLEHICQLVFLWKQQHDSRRERYGVSPDERQQRRLTDLRESYSRLAEALEELRHEIADIHEERLSEQSLKSGADNGTQKSEYIAIANSVSILEKFRSDWEELMNPDSADGAGGIFDNLFGPVSA